MLKSQKTKTSTVLINTTNKNIPVSDKAGATFMLSPKSKITVTREKYGDLPKGVIVSSK